MRQFSSKYNINQSNTKFLSMTSIASSEAQMVEAHRRINKLINDERMVKNRVNMLETEQKDILRKVDELRF